MPRPHRHNDEASSDSMYTQNKEGKSMLEPIWAWGILGLILLAIEMASGTFYIFWFGIAALCMCAALWFFPGMPVSLQLLAFAALSLSSLAIWKLNYKSILYFMRIKPIFI